MALAYPNIWTWNIAINYTISACWDGLSELLDTTRYRDVSFANKWTEIILEWNVHHCSAAESTSSQL